MKKREHSHSKIAKANRVTSIWLTGTSHGVCFVMGGGGGLLGDFSGGIIMSLVGKI